MFPRWFLKLCMAWAVLALPLWIGLSLVSGMPYLPFADVFAPFSEGGGLVFAIGSLAFGIALLLPLLMLPVAIRETKRRGADQ